MKTFRRVLIGGLVLVILAGAVVILYADHLARSAVEQGATEALGVDTQVRRADVGIFTDRSSLHGVRVRNPKGFDARNLLEVDSSEVEADVFDLLDDTVRVDRLTIRGVEVELEQKSGRSNYGTVLDHVRRYRRTRGVDGGKQFVFDLVEVRDITARVDLLGEVGEMVEAGELAAMTIEVPDLRLENVGGGQEGGAVIGRVTEQIVAVLVRRALAEGRQQLRRQLPDAGWIDKLIKIREQ